MSNKTHAALEPAPYFVTEEDLRDFFDAVPTNPEIKDAAMELVDSIFTHTEITPAQFTAMQHLKRCVQWTVPGCTPKPIDFEAKAQKAFETYQTEINGLAMIGWSSLSPALQASWISAAQAILS